MARYLRRLTVAHTEEVFLVRIKAVSLSIPVDTDLRGVYIKCTRGATRIKGDKRYVLCPENFNIELEDCFEKESVFYRKGDTNNYDEKLVSHTVLPTEYFNLIDFRWLSK